MEGDTNFGDRVVLNGLAVSVRQRDPSQNFHAPSPWIPSTLCAHNVIIFNDPSHTPEAV